MEVFKEAWGVDMEVEEAEGEEGEAMSHDAIVGALVGLVVSGSMWAAYLTVIEILHRKGRW